MERLGDLCHLAARAWSASDDKASRQKILASTELRLNRKRSVEALENFCAQSRELG